MSQVTELGYLTIGVSDLPAWDHFAAHVLGLEVVPGESESVRYLRMDYWHHRIKLVQDGSDDLLTAGLRVAGVTEFRAMHKRLSDAGVPLRIGTTAEAEASKVLEIMYLEDPNGYPIEIFHGPLMQYNLPYHPGRRMHGGYRTGDGGLGHMMQSQKVDYDEIHAFYSMLGFCGGIEYKMQPPIIKESIELMFMHCNERHHTLAFGTPAEKRCNHIFFETERIEDVGLAYDLVRAEGIPVILQPGVHANDQNFSFYFKNPSGFMNEIGWGGRAPTGQSEYHARDTFGHQTVAKSSKSFMVPA